MTTQLVPWQRALVNSERKFNEITEEVKNEVSYKAESMFAFQAITANKYLADIANNNPDSLRDAIINIASVGLSLNPITQYAYLVPRNGSACLDISYKGLIKLATDSGAMAWVRADLVYESDAFVYRGPAEKPEHSGQVFGDRGEFVGIYCLAKTVDGDFLVETMTAHEIGQARDASAQWQNSQSGPWKDWFGEMAKKTVIKRASKTWPRTRSERLAVAVDVLSEDCRSGNKTGATLPAPPTIDMLINELDRFFDAEQYGEEDLDNWLIENRERIDLLTSLDRTRFDNYVTYEVRDLLQEISAPKTITTIECPNGFEVELDDCPQCPNVETCKAYQNGAKQ